MEFSRIADNKRLRFILTAITKNIPAGEEILDVGCGNGIITATVGKSGFVVTGIDASEKTIAAARSANNLPNVKFMVVTAGELAVQRGRFSAIICSEVLEHLHDPSSLLNILKMSLKDNGILVVTVPNGRGPRELLVTKPVQYLQKKNNLVWKFVSSIKKILGYRGLTEQSGADDLTHIQFFTRKDLQHLAHKHGFQIINIEKSNFVEQVFPFSLIIKRSAALQKLDCNLADRLPLAFTSGFMMVWRKM
jgi:2-polyprenyl-3-methyl-5-hydroxy-6-metoxy-1,4-benzoquinol methylase